MTELLVSEHGFAVLLVGVIILLALNLITRVGEFVFKLIEKKNHGTDTQIREITMTLTQNTDAVREVRVILSVIQQELGEVKKFKADTDLAFTAIKKLAGKDWPKLRKAIEEERPPKA
jgi:hypothetical protein